MNGFSWLFLILSACLFLIGEFTAGIVAFGFFTVHSEYKKPDLVEVKNNVYQFQQATERNRSNS